MKNKIIRTIFGAGIIAIASSASAEDSGRSVWEAIVDTLPAGVVSEETLQEATFPTLGSE